jgi:thiamine-phosphate diphosphorylase/hydroxyethylthiazole kinase
MAIDYSLYLVTDSTPQILGDRSLVEVVEAAINGGAKLMHLQRDRSQLSIYQESQLSSTATRREVLQN